MGTIRYFDPSKVYRKENREVTEKNKQMHDKSLDFYLLMHSNQTVSFVEEKKNYWLKFDKTPMSVMDALDKLKVLVDESDPGVDVIDYVHAFHTAERIRKAEEPDWFQLTGLIHDLGKIMLFNGEPEWAVVGDTFPVGCAYADSIAYKNETFRDNTDLNIQEYRTAFGVYPRLNCSLDKVTMCWGHDEYLYQVLKYHPNCTLPDEALYMIRYHSFYPWHTGNEEHLCNEKDLFMRSSVKKFNAFDLNTTKESTEPNIWEVYKDSGDHIDSLKPYYQSLINTYIPGVVKW